MAFVEDIDVFINNDTPGFKTLNVDGGSVNGIFTDDFDETNFVESSNPVFVTKTSDVPSVANGSVVMDGAKEYQVIGIQDDGSGVTKLALRFRL